MPSVPIPEEAFRFTAQPDRCSYLPQERSSLTYRVYPEITPEELEQLICRGWRRFTAHVFRPACARCQKCLSIRVPVHSFQPSKSQRRTQRDNQQIDWIVQRPTITQRHLDLYNHWHENRTETRGWNDIQLNAEHYREHFLLGNFPSLHEVLYFANRQLVGVGLIEVLPASLSSVYFFYDPEWAPLSPGTYSALCEIEFARQTGRQHVYFGYWIKDCPSMSYKNRFRPYEILQGLPNDNEAPVWLPEP